MARNQPFEVSFFFNIFYRIDYRGKLCSAFQLHKWTWVLFLPGCHFENSAFMLETEVFYLNYTMYVED